MKSYLRYATEKNPFAYICQCNKFSSRVLLNTYIGRQRQVLKDRTIFETLP